jgi:photosystem II stability/assembly factor-like uncharacterized protein
MNKKSNPWRRWITALIVSIVGVLIGITSHQIRQPVTIAWEPLGGPVRSIVRAVALDPTDPDIIYVGTNESGVYKSTDGGITWDKKSDGLIRDILISRTGAIYAATWGGEGIYRSNDGGEIWTPELVDVFTTGDEADWDLIIESAHVRVLLETETAILAGTAGGVFQLDPDKGCWLPTGLKGKDISVRALLVHPHRTETLYAATRGRGIYKSEDGGQNWLPKNEGLESELAQEINALVFDPVDPNVMYTGTFGDGVYRSLDSGESWEAWSEGLPEKAEVWSLRFAVDRTLFVGLRYGGTYKRTEPGEWQKATLPYGALALEVDSRTDAMYVGTWGGGLYRDEKGRDESLQDWQNLGLPTDYLRLSAAAFIPPTFYVGTLSDGIYASEDGGQTWERRSRGLEGVSLTALALAISPDGHTLYIGTGDGVFVSADGERQWAPLGVDTRPAGDFSVVSLAIGRNPQGQDVIYAGTQRGLWTFDSNQQVWDGPKEFQFRTPEQTKKEVLISSLLVEDDVVYASVGGLGVYKGSNQERKWSPVEMAPKYVETLTLADKTWLQWGGKQFYALTERGLYGSRNGKYWDSLDPVLLEAITIDPFHPQVAYASITLYPKPDNELDATLSVTSTAILASVNDGREWRFTHDQDESPIQDTSPIEGHVAHLVRDPGDSHRIFALAANGGLYRGYVHLPWLVHEVVVWWLVGLASFAVFVVAPYGYFNLMQAYTLPSHRLAWGLLAHFWLLLRVQSQRFQNRLNSRLMMALKDLAGYGLLKEQDGGFRYTTPGLQNVAAVEFRESEDALIEDMRRENRLLKDIERFFEAAGFDVRQDAPQRLTKFVLQPRRSLYRDYRQLYAWLQSEGPLQGTEVDTICQEAIENQPLLAPGGAPAECPVPVAFIIVTELPEVEAFRQMRVRQEQVRLIPLSTTTICSALRERSAVRDLDVLIQQERGRADLYDIRTPVIDRLDFFGRQDIVDNLKRELREGHSVDVWSLPGMGKTSLLWHLKETLVNPVVAYADLEYGWQGEPLFHEQIITDLANDLWRKYSRFFDESTDNFGEQLLSIAQAVPVRGERDAQVVLLLDGFSVAAGDEEQQRTIEHLRHLVDTHPNLALVVAWQDSEVTTAIWTPLGVLDEKESEQLITTIGIQMGLEFTQGSLVNIYRETGGHPLLLRQLGSAIAQQAPVRPLTEFSQVTPVRVDRAISHYRSIRGHYFKDVWQWCSPDQKEGLRAWSAMPKQEKERLLNINPYLRALMRPDETLGDLFIAWVLAATEENRL